MLKKLVIPVFMFALAIAGASAGCGSDSNSTGKAGSGGGAGSGAGTGGGGAGSGGAGTTGSAGSDAGAGTTGAAGSDAAAGTTGAAGSDAGSDVAAEAGGDVASEAGGDVASEAGATEGGSDSGSSVNLTTVKAACPAKMTAMNAATPYTAAEFCALFLDTCTGGNAGTITAANCVATYEGWAGKKITNPATDSLQSCTSYHLCNATGANQAGTHCPHAAGTGPCAHP